MMFSPQDGWQAFAAPAKLNLFLHIVGRRADGYHLLQSVFQLIDLADTLYLRVRADGDVVHHNPLPDVPASQDLIVRAARLLQQETGCTAGVDLGIEKRIPMGGGLGGGSSDAATVLLALNRLWNLQLSREKLMQIGLQLGADVPFFIYGQNAFVEGIGEIMTPLTTPDGFFLVLHPQVHVPTPAIFKADDLVRDTLPITAQAIDYQQTRNDLEAVACRLFPALLPARAALAQHLPTRMTGSGACFFAFSASQNEIARVISRLPNGATVFEAKSLSRHPLYEYAV
ncbi:4-diphosphocytidyl-2-C-methyl-D-erythritol kinase [Andreprevotia lacus DSM 23236]|uniref:4-diphosphocytidyl-2-C-methyl-D-erythritol kinase n=1 Tax=Andreprevotia lacus DSM 23236 TaxID=1121001 RepID=A0A1W1XSW3_9NEIS|nr:4-(cytidine 5'-diphospho)-2-C-methyl-D-erythritol kinase [Andreprevotia lacus]SMC26977.1 4-diphosphocytidyl-2-C-methyl-D-erythritol kinase [Andreprevotia lacus DSM 23236]